MEEDWAVGTVLLVPLLPLERFESFDLLEFLDESVDDWSGLEVFERRLKLLKKGILAGNTNCPNGSPLPY